MKLKDIQLVKEATGQMVADLFTKQLAFPLFRQHREKLGVVPDSQPYRT
jgi:hypothetical protein